MKRLFNSKTITISLAIFSMLFGAGNLMYPLKVGMSSGDQNLIGMLGFFVTAVVLPICGLLAMILFDGNYDSFFKRLGYYAGSAIIWACMMFIGPFVAIPRITTLSHTMVAPFIPIEFLQNITPFSSFIFSLIFLGITFLATYRENKIMELLGNIISPILLISLSIIIVKGLLTSDGIAHNMRDPFDLFKENFMRGYETLDLIGALFFASIVLHLLKSTLGRELAQNPRYLALVGLHAGILGTLLLGLVYVGMSYLGVFHGSGLSSVNAGELFREISFRVLGNKGAFIIATAVVMACLSTAIALAAVVGEYVQFTIFRNKINYVTALIITLLACIPLSTAGLGTILSVTGGVITKIVYPVLIVITLCNIAYKLFGFKPIKLPVLITFIIMLISYWQ